MNAEPDLDAIEARARSVTYALDHGHVAALASFGYTVAREDVPALAAEVRRLRAGLTCPAHGARMHFACGCTLGVPEHTQTGRRD